MFKLPFPNQVQTLDRYCAKTFAEEQPLLPMFYYSFNMFHSQTLEIFVFLRVSVSWCGSLC